MQDNLQTLGVDLGTASYPIWVGADLLLNPVAVAALLRDKIVGKQCVLVSNDKVAPLYIAALRACIDQVSQATGTEILLDEFLLPDGEAHKTLDNYTALLDFLLARKHNRSTTVIALGGGVVGDLAGFVAASYQRGVNFIQVPTTLLAQVDSSVGGKTAVNHPLGKNMIGAFYQPACVLIDTDTLASLDERDYLAGLAEVIKYGVISAGGFFTWLETNLLALLDREASALRHAIVESCRIKAAVVAQDETEQGLRAILNYGHTFGHALENLSGYGTLRHGEAVAIGMVQAADFAVRLGLFSLSDAQRVKALIAATGLPVVPATGLDGNDLIAAMALDKKTRDGTLRFVLPSEIGAVAVHNIGTDEQMKALKETLGAGHSLCEEPGGKGVEND